MSPFARLAHPLLFAVDPERAHRIALRALAAGLVPRQGPDAPSLRTSVLGADLANPFGTAAGFDKHAEAADAIVDIGFGFAELGGVTPLAQPGNPRPRVFRAISDRAVINRLGLNSVGMEAVRARLAARRRHGFVGVNIGANKDSTDWAQDYARLVACLAPVSGFLTINVSSPNTPGLRDLQRRDALARILDAVLAARAALGEEGASCRILLKIAPDLAEPDFHDMIAVIRASAIDGLVVSNTTLARTGLTDARFAAEKGGLSGAPLFRRSTALLARTRLAVGPEMPIVGVGGVMSGQAAYAKIRAGADLVQLYTGLIYEGVGLLGEMKRHVAAALADDGLARVSQAVGLDAERWAADVEWS